MTYPLTLVSDCIGTLGGFLAKNDKSKGFHFLTADEGEHKETKGLLTFLFTADNKRQLISVLLKVWGSDQFAYKLKHKHVMCICEDDAVLLSSNSRIIIIARRNQLCKYIRVKSPDTDLVFIIHAIIYWDHNFIWNLQRKQRNRKGSVIWLINREDYVEFSALLGLHAFTMCDICSAFKAIGESKTHKGVAKECKIQCYMFVRAGNNWEVPADMFSDAEELTCALYGKPI